MDFINKLEADLEVFKGSRGKRIDTSKIEKIKNQHQDYSFHNGKLE